MNEVFFHLDRLKIILKGNNIKSIQNKIIFSNNLPENKNSCINRHSLFLNTNNNKYNNNYNNTAPILRPSIINLNNRIQKIDFEHKFYIIEDSSETEDCYNEETKEIIPSLAKVVRKIPDPNKIMILTDVKFFPKEATPGLIITGIEEWVLEKHIKYFLQGVPTLVDLNKKKYYYKNNDYNDYYLDIISINIFEEQKNRFAFVQLKSFKEMEVIGNFFLAPIKRIYPSYNSKKEKIEVFFAYNILELTKNHWYGVILRNLPVNCNDKSLYNFTEQKVENGIKYCSNPVTIDNFCCALVVCKELESAEKLCFDLNNSEINNKLIKAHLHPNTCKIRNEINSKNFDTFSKNGYEYNNKADESEKCLKHSKNFMEFFFPNYINSFFNNKIRKKEEENRQNNTDKNKIKNAINTKENVEKEKALKKKKDMDLANSIFNFFKKSNSNNFSQNNANKNKISKLNNNTTAKIEKNNSDNLLNSNNLRLNLNEIFPNQKSKETIKENSNSNEDKKEENAKNEYTDILIKKNVSSNNEENKKEKGENENKEKPEYNEKEVKYYTYNMEDSYYYNEKEKEEQRKALSKYNRNIRDNIYNSNYNNYNSNYHKYSQSYKKYDNKMNSLNNHYLNSKYKRYNYENTYKDRDRNTKKDREWENAREIDKEFSNDSQNKRLERSRDKIINGEETINKRRNKINQDYDKRNGKEHYKFNRYKKYNNDNKYFDKNNNNKYFNKNKNYNKYYDINNTKYYERREDSFHSKSNNKNVREKRDKYNN